MENKERFDFKNKKNIFLGIITVVSFIFIGSMYLYTKDKRVLIFSIIFSLFIIEIFILYIKFFNNYMKNIFEQLSDMISTIADMKEVEVFSTLEDNMLSKLQFQVSKLTGILKEKNKQITKERDDIKTLISDMSHQLKTPISNLKMYFEFLKEENLSKKEKDEFIEIIEGSIIKLEFLIEKIIKMSRLENGVIQLKIEKNNLNDTILMAIRQAYQKANKKNIEISFEEKEKVCLFHDKIWTTEALYNILDNAIKYTPENGTIKIMIESYDLFAHIDIADSGIGINEEEKNLIFQRFYRGKNTLNIEGIGIGLYLSRKIFSMQNGYIKVKSDKKGTKFSIYMQIKG